MLVFRNLWVLGYQRSWVQAFGFYAAYLTFRTVSIWMLMTLATTVMPGMPAGGLVSIAAIIGCPALGYLILRSKGLHTDTRLVAIALGSGLIAAFLGSPGGLIPVAWFTTMAEVTATMPEAMATVEAL